MNLPHEDAKARAIFRLIAETIKEAGADGMPSGPLFTSLNSFGMSLATYNATIGIMKAAGFVEENNHVLTWIGG